MTDSLKSFAFGRPLIEYSAYNWYEHFLQGGQKAQRLLLQDRYLDVLDISKNAFWIWALLLVDYMRTRYVTPWVVISNIWDNKETKRAENSYGSFLREHCLGKMFAKGIAVKALFDDDEAKSQSGAR